MDEECWKAYPEHHLFFNKLWVAQQLGYKCGPGGVSIPETGFYIVRPIYNLDGMSRGAQRKFLNAGDFSTPPGYFWCEYFDGHHYSVDFKRTSTTDWECDLVVRGIKVNEYKFVTWTKIKDYSKDQFTLPDFIKSTYINPAISYINVEYIDSKIIEIHLRRNPDFIGHDFDRLDVVWDSDKWNTTPERAGTFIHSPEEAEFDSRIGFYGRKLDGLF